MHKRGDESIGGVKTFNYTPKILRDNPYLAFVEMDQTRWTRSGTTYSGIWFQDKNQEDCGAVVGLNYENHCAIRLITHSKDSSGNLNNNYLEISGGDGANIKAFSPFSTKTFSLGSSGHLWSQLYCNNATINTSDEKEKSNITEIPDEVLDAWEEVSFYSFQFNDALEKKGNSARIHSGLVSQRINDVFAKHGLDGFRYALLCRDQGEAVDRDETDHHGIIHHFHEDAYDNWGIRYEEALCVEAAYQRRQNSRMQATIQALEQRIALLEEKIKQEG